MIPSYRQTPMQRVVNSLDEGIALGALRGLLVLLPVLAIGMLYARLHFTGLRDREAMDCAQIARNIASGRGFVTDVVRPITLWHEGGRTGRLVEPARNADLFHAPLYPSLLAAGFRAFNPSFQVSARFLGFEPESRVILPLGLILWMATGVIVFALGRMLFDSRVAVLATLGYMLSDAVLADAISGRPDALGVFLVTASAGAALAWAFRDADGGGRGVRIALFVLAALCAGLAFLARYALGVAAVVVVLFVVARSARRQWLAGALMLALIAATASPWIARNIRVSGRPFGLAPIAALNAGADSPTAERAVTQRLDNADIAWLVRSRLADGLGKAGAPDRFGLGLGLFVGAFVLSFLHRFSRPEVRSFRWCAAAGLAVVLAAGSIAPEGSGPLVRSLLPVVVLYGCALIVLLVDRLELVDPLLKYVAAGLIVLVGLFPTILSVSAGDPESPYPPYYPPYITRVSSLMKPDEALCTDIPEAAAWYGRCRTLQLPRTMHDLESIRDAGMKIGGVYLTTVTANRRYIRELTTGPERSWLPLLEGRMPRGFPYTEGIRLPPGGRDQLFLTDLGRLPK